MVIKKRMSILREIGSMLQFNVEYTKFRMIEPITA